MARGEGPCGPRERVLFTLCHPHVPVKMSLYHVLVVCLDQWLSNLSKLENHLEGL